MNKHGSEFLCGANYTMADCMYTCMMARLNLVNLLEDQLKTKPKLALWWNRVQARPSFKAAGLFKEPLLSAWRPKKCAQFFENIEESPKNVNQGHCFL